VEVISFETFAASSNNIEPTKEEFSANCTNDKMSSLLGNTLLSSGEVKVTASIMISSRKNDKAEKTFTHVDNLISMEDTHFRIPIRMNFRLYQISPFLIHPNYIFKA